MSGGRKASVWGDLPRAVIKAFSWFPREDQLYSDDTAGRETVIAVIKGQFDEATFISMRVKR